ncbi:hypothetical protein RSAG8_11221, partial [Rhizoctonia solani AG-8 WAC10335]
MPRFESPIIHSSTPFCINNKQTIVASYSPERAHQNNL